MKINTIINHLLEYFPLEKQLSFDNCGLQIGSLENDATRVMVSLNCDEAAIDSAITNKCNLLITHHPLFFDAIKNIDFLSSSGRIIKKAIQENITIYSLHTCLDIGTNDFSMNEWLIKELPVNNIENYDEYCIGKKAHLNQPMTIEAFVDLVKTNFKLTNIKYVSKPEKVISKISLCGGSACDDIYHLANQVDVHISGDSKYHQGQFALENDIALIDVGHHIEVIMEQKLSELLNCFEIEVIQANQLDYFTYQ